MYRCHVEFYLINCPPNVLETITALPVLEGFDHAFTSSSEPQSELLARADVILAVPARGEETVRILSEGRKSTAELILLSEQEQTASLSNSVALANELWRLPMTETELRFRFRR